MPHAQNQNLEDAKDTYTAVQQLSQILDTGLDPEVLSICMQLCEAGINPDALAACIRELQKEVATLPQDGLNRDDLFNQNN